MAEILTHIAFYAGWPNAWAAFNMAKEVYAEDEADGAGVEGDGARGGNDESGDGEGPESNGGFFGLGKPNDGFAQYFIGQSYLNALTRPDDYLAIFNVTFEPGCRNNWHIHHASKGGGQVLVCVDGEGWYQEEGKPAERLRPGDVVEIPANVKHWHGAQQTAGSATWPSSIPAKMRATSGSNRWTTTPTTRFLNAEALSRPGGRFPDAGALSKPAGAFPTLEGAFPTWGHL